MKIIKSTSCRLLQICTVKRCFRCKLKSEMHKADTKSILAFPTYMSFLLALHTFYMRFNQGSCTVFNWQVSLNLKQLPTPDDFHNKICRTSLNGYMPGINTSLQEIQQLKDNINATTRKPLKKSLEVRHYAGQVARSLQQAGSHKKQLCQVRQ